MKIERQVKVYLAAPLFTDAEKEYNKYIASILKNNGILVFLPQEQCEGLTDPQEICEKNLNGLSKCDIVLAVLDGADADSGTCFECGIGYAYGKPFIGLRTDFRGSGDDGGFNLMLSQSALTTVGTVNQAIEALEQWVITSSLL